MSVLKTTSLTRDFGNHKGAFDINLNLEPSKILGFIGPNGAGKSTTINMVSGFIIPDSGSIEIFGVAVNYLNIHKIYHKIGLLLSEVSFENQLTPKQIFQQSEAMLNSNFEQNWRHMAEYIELDLNKKFSSLSLGNKKKVGIINCLMHDPQLVILDEPSSGLDPLIQQKLFVLLKKVTDRRGSVLLSSHVLSEVQSACDSVVMIKDGNIILHDSTDHILERALKVFKFKNLSENLLRDLNRQNLIKKLEHISGETLLYTDKHSQVLKTLMANDVYDFYLESPGLENMFLEYYK